MSGLPPPGMRQVVDTLRVARSTTEIEPSRRLETYRNLESRLTYSPWAPLPVGRKPSDLNVSPSTKYTPPATWSAT